MSLTVILIVNYNIISLNKACFVIIREDVYVKVYNRNKNFLFLRVRDVSCALHPSLSTVYVHTLTIIVSRVVVRLDRLSRALLWSLVCKLLNLKDLLGDSVFSVHHLVELLDSFVGKLLINGCVSYSEGDNCSADLDCRGVFELERILILKEDKGSELRPVVFNVDPIGLVLQDCMAP